MYHFYTDFIGLKMVTPKFSKVRWTVLLQRVAMLVTWSCLARPWVGNKSSSREGRKHFVS